jgi:hypothetical protein
MYAKFVSLLEAQGSGCLVQWGSSSSRDLVRFEYITVSGGDMTLPDEGRDLVVCRLLIGGPCGGVEGCGIKWTIYGMVRSMMLRLHPRWEVMPGQE